MLSLMAGPDATSDASMHAQDEVSGPVQSQDTTQLRLAALFIILIAGLCGALPPLFMKAFRNHDGLASQLSRSLAAGVILALALVHIIPEAIEDMSGLGGMTYPLGGLCVLGGVALMLLLEHLSQILHNSQAAVAAAAGTGGCGHSHGSSSRGRDSGLVNDRRRRAGTASARRSSGTSSIADGCSSHSVPLLAGMEGEAGDEEGHHYHDHDHHHQHNHHEHYHAHDVEAPLTPEGPGAGASAGPCDALGAISPTHHGHHPHEHAHNKQHTQQDVVVVVVGQQKQGRGQQQQQQQERQGEASSEAGARLRPVHSHLASMPVDIDLDAEASSGSDSDGGPGAAAVAAAANGHSHGHSHSQHQAPGGCNGSSSGGAKSHDRETTHSHEHDNEHDHGHSHSHLAGEPKHQGHGAHAHAKHTLPPHHPGAHGHAAEQQHKPHAQQHPASYEQLPPQHQHTCVTYGNAPSLLTIAVGNGGEAAVGGDAAAAGGLGGGSLRLRLLAYMFELGCVFHSLIIGVAVGVITEDVAQVRALLIALSFHQWLEGLGLGSVIARGGFSTLKAAAMAGFYSLTCPAGVAAGMALARLYDPESEVARGVQGTLDGVSGGMLLYISLVQLVAEDMGRFVPAGGEGGAGAGRRLMSFAALCGGAGAMCLLAVWT